MGSIAGIIIRALPQTEVRANITLSTGTRGCMFNATTSADAGRCTVHRELDSNQSTRCVAGEEAVDRPEKFDRRLFVTVLMWK